MKRRPRWDATGVRGLRQHLGITQVELAQELGTRQQTISEWERGLYYPRGASATLLSLVAERAGFGYEATTAKGGAEDRGATIRLYRGDIADLEVEAIVNAANNVLWMGGGVAGAIVRKGGREIETEAVRLGPIPIGESVVTGAGRLKARYVIHAAVMGQDLATDADKIKKATASALRRAVELEVGSLALPALGTGVGGFPVRECARIMLGEVKGHLAGSTALGEVIFAVWGEKDYKAFQEALESTG